MSLENNISIRKSGTRGIAELGWLHSQHTFSFGGYHDPDHMGYRALRVINEDRVEPGQGFGTHPHQEMEILSYVIEGALEHKDSMGNGSIIRPGDVQLLSAGTGLTHSEFNPQEEAPVHFLQIWIEPNETGVPPRYQQESYSREEKTNRLRLVASPDGAERSVALRQDARLYASILEPGEEATLTTSPRRHTWIQVIKGKLSLFGETVEAGDGAAIEDVDRITLTGGETAEILVFDLA